MESTLSRLRIKVEGGQINFINDYGDHAIFLGATTLLS